MQSKVFLVLICLVLSSFAHLQTSQITQESVQKFLKQNQMMGVDSAITNFNVKGKQVCVKIQNSPGSITKYILYPQSDGKFSIKMMQSFSYSSNSFSSNEFFNPQQMFSSIPFPLMIEQSIPTPITTNPQIQMLPFEQIVEEITQDRSRMQKNRMRGMRGMKHRGIKNIEDQKELLEELLEKSSEEFEGAKIVSVEKYGHVRGQGIFLTIQAVKNNQKYKIDARFKPRKHQLIVKEFEKIQQNNKQQTTENVHDLKSVSNLVKGILDIFSKKQPILGGDNDPDFMPTQEEQTEMPLLGGKNDPDSNVDFMKIIGSIIDDSKKNNDEVKKQKVLDSIGGQIFENKESQQELQKAQRVESIAKQLFESAQKQEAQSEQVSEIIGQKLKEQR